MLTKDELKARLNNACQEVIAAEAELTDVEPGMIYNEWGKFWVNESVDQYDYKIEYLKFEEGTRFPEILSKVPHVAYKVDNADPYIADADRVVFGPEVLSDTVRLAFIIKDDALIELYEEK